MTTHDHRRPPVRGSDTVPPRLPTRRSMCDRSGRSRLRVVRDSDAYGTPVELRTLIASSLPPDVRGALVTQAEGTPGGRLRAVWWRNAGPARIPPGEILLSWTPADDEGRTDVTARLGLEGGQILLASWPGLRGDWSAVVRPTVAEVRELHAALRLATVVLNRLADGAADGGRGD